MATTYTTSTTSTNCCEELRSAILTLAEIIEDALDRQTVQLTVMANKQTIIASQQTIIASQQTIIAEKQTAIETYQKKLKELGEGDGIHWRRPNEFLTGAATFRVTSGNDNVERVVSIQNINESYTGGTST